MSDVMREDILLRAGAGTMLSYGPGWRVVRYDAAQAEGFTFTRADASTCATYADRDGALRTAAAGKLRASWIDADRDGTPETLGYVLEAAATNRAVYAEDVAEVTAGAWTLTNIVSVSANVVVAPDGTTTADRPLESTASGAHAIGQTLAITTGQSVAWSGFVKDAGQSRHLRLIVDDTGGTDDYRVSVDVSNVALATLTTVGVAGVTFATVYEVGNDWLYVGLVGAINSTHASARCRAFYTATFGGNGSYLGDGASGLYLWGWQAEVGVKYPSSYIKTAAASISRAADALSYPVGFPPSELTAYLKAVNLGASLVTNARMMQIGGTGSTGPLLRVDSDGAGIFRVVHDNATASVASTCTTTVAYGQAVEWCVKLASNGSVQLDQSIASGTITAAATSTSNSLGTAWVANTMVFGVEGGMALVDCLVVRGSHTMAEMRARL